MCGIGGFSLSSKSRLNPRKISNALLTEMDIRGNQASGYAFQSAKGSGVFKLDTAGSRLPLKGMAKDARSVILHTRYATHGTITNMANNHPVQSPDENIALVHNGVIYNHDLVRKSLDFTLPEVDTAVIPAILQQFDNDTNKFSMLDGDASVAWLDENDRGVLRVARISHSPLVVAQSKDGSFFFASTESILLGALERAGIKPTFLQTVNERTLMTVRAGRLDSVEILPDLDPKFEEFSSYNYAKYRGMTAGGKSVGIGYGTPSDVSGRTVKYQSAFGDVYVPESWEKAGDEPCPMWDEPEFPEVQGLTVNGYGEYFDPQGMYVGDVQDLYEMGYIDQDGGTYSWDDGESYLAVSSHRKFKGGAYGMWD